MKFKQAAALHQQGKLAEAGRLYAEVLREAPNHFDALHLLGVIALQTRQTQRGVALIAKAIKLKPGSAAAYNNLGNGLHALKHYTEAIASYDKAIALKPDYAEAYSNHGNVLNTLNKHAEALTSYDRAIALKPNYVDAYYNRGNALNALNRHREALESYDRALALRPDYAEAHYNGAFCRLLMGDLPRGWQENEWRWETDEFRSYKRSFVQPLWLGQEAVAGKTILLHAEQGLGDSIQFCRYVPLVAARGARVVLEVPRPLHDLMSTLAGSPEVIDKGSRLPEFDMHCPLLSLPLAFGTTLETIPSSVPYLQVSPAGGQHWNARLGANRGRRVGLAWSGRPTHKNDQNRSIGLQPLLPLLDTGATFVCLQKDIRPDDAEVLKGHKAILDFSDELNDFSDTAALISQLDLVISVDTSVAHLAGALAKPVWVLLPFIPDWRWLLDRDDNPWYPTARLFRQDDTRAWDGVIVRVHDALKDFCP